MFTYEKPEQKKESKKPITAPNLTGIPDQMKTRFENLSGFSFDDVRVHYNSDKPAQLQALAYTRGNQVYVAPGQEKHLRHELGHVVQQKAGVVKATNRVNGIPVNTDPRLEREADTGIKGSLPDVLSVSEQSAAQFVLSDYVNCQKMLVDDFVYEIYSLGKSKGAPPKEVIDTLNIESIMYMRRFATDKSDDVDYSDYETKVIKPWMTVSASICGIETLTPLIMEAKVHAEKYIINYKNGTDQKVPKPSDMQRSYDSAHSSEYEDIRKQKEQANALGGKIFLRNLKGSTGGERVYKTVGKLRGLTAEQIKALLPGAYADDEAKETAARKQYSTDASKADDHVKVVPVLFAPEWNATLNDAFVGGGIDAKARFKIDDIADTSAKYIQELSNTSGEKEKTFLTWCHRETTDTALKKTAGTSTITVLAREIGQLLGKEYIFKNIPSKKGLATLQAFHPDRNEGGKLSGFIEQKERSEAEGKLKTQAAQLKKSIAQILLRTRTATQMLTKLIVPLKPDI